jgi:hypothetical protein
MWRPALGEQIDGHQPPAVPPEEITIMSLYGDFEFVRAETDYRLERGRVAPWIVNRSKAVRRRVPMRRTPAESVRRSRHAA